MKILVENIRGKNILKNSLLVTLYLFLLPLPILAQEHLINSFMYPIRNVNASPHAASLGLYMDSNVDMFTGQTKIEIPIYKLQVGRHELPITLSYSTGGFRVNELASWVGLGWSLNAGGMITREIRGLPDELNYNGYTSSSGNIFYQELKDGILSWEPGESMGEYLTLLDYATGLMDGEPDIYSFIVGNLSGKFVFDKDKQIKFIGEHKDRFKISVEREYIATNPSYNSIKSFILTDDKGVKYYFGNNFKEKLLNQHYFTYHDTEDNYLTLTNDYYQKKYYGGKYNKMWHNENTFYYLSWYIYKIEFPDNISNINFTYLPENNSFYSSTSETKYVGERYEVDGSAIPVDPQHPFSIRRINNYQTTQSYRLTSITCDDIVIDFLAEQEERQDINDPILGSVSIGNAKALDKIIIHSVLSSNRITWEFYKSYFQPENDYSHELQYFPTFTKRLKLDSIKEGEKKWKFDYYEGNLPPRNSSEIDFWGYYKKQSINQRTSTPITYVYPLDYNNTIYNSIYSIYPRTNYSGEEYVLNDVGKDIDREPNFENTRAYVLKKISYPTKGYKLFEYELNNFLIDGIERVGPGLRIRSVSSLSDENQLPIVENFSYTENGYSSGLITELPDFAHRNVDAMWINNSYNTIFSPEEIQNVITIRKNLSYCSIGQVSGGFVGYKKIVKSISGNGSTEYFFSFNPSFLSQDFEPFTRKTIRKEHAHIDYYHLIENHFFDSYNVKDIYPHFSEPNCNWNIGNIEREVAKNEKGDIVLDITYNYTAIENVNEDDIYYINAKMYYSHFWDKEILHNQTPIDYYLLQFNDIVWGVNYYNTGYKRLESITTKTFHNSMSPIVEHQNYEYSGFLLRQISKSHSQKDNLLKTRYLYPQDIINNKCLLSYSSCMEMALIYKNDRDADCFGNANCLVQSNNHYIQDTTSCGNTYRNCQSGSWLNKNDGLALKMMIEKNILSEPIEIMEIIFRNNKDFLLNGSVSRNKLFNDEIVLNHKKYLLNNNEPIESFYGCYIDGNQELTFNSKYIEKLSIDKYDTKLNITEYLSNLTSEKALIWGYNQLFQIANISNATLPETGHTSFENNELNGWIKYEDNDFVTDPENVFTGKGAMSVTGNGPFQTFTVGQNAEKHSGYKASVWAKGEGAYLHIEVNGEWSSHVKVKNEINDGLWHKLEVELPRHKIQPYFSQGENLKIKVYVGTERGTVYFDDLRFHPSDAQMTTYTHEPLIGVTSISNESNKPEFYIYDSFGRLEYIKDFEGNIIKKNDYHYRTNGQ